MKKRIIYLFLLCLLLSSNLIQAQEKTVFQKKTLFEIKPNESLSTFKLSQDGEHYVAEVHSYDRKTDAETTRIIKDGKLLFETPESIYFIDFKPQSSDVYIISEKKVSQENFWQKELKRKDELRDKYELSLAESNYNYTLYKNEQKIGEYKFLHQSYFSSKNEHTLFTGFNLQGKAVAIFDDQEYVGDDQISQGYRNSDSSLNYIIKKNGKYEWIQNGNLKDKFDEYYYPSSLYKKNGKLYRMNDGNLSGPFPFPPFNFDPNTSERSSRNFLIINKIEYNKEGKRTFKQYLLSRHKIIGPFDRITALSFPTSTLNEPEIFIAERNDRSFLYEGEEMLIEMSSFLQSREKIFQDKVLLMGCEGKECIQDEFSNKKAKGDFYLIWGKEKWGPYVAVSAFSKKGDVAFLLKSQTKSELWDNGLFKELPLAVDEFPGTIIFSGKKLVYNTNKKNEHYLHLDNEVFGPFDAEVKEITISPDFSTYAFIGEKWNNNNLEKFLYVNGKLLKGPLEKGSLQAIGKDNQVHYVTDKLMQANFEKILKYVSKTKDSQENLSTLISHADGKAIASSKTLGCTKSPGRFTESCPNQKQQIYLRNKLLGTFDAVLKADWFRHKKGFWILVKQNNQVLELDFEEGDKNEI